MAADCSIAKPGAGIQSVATSAVYHGQEEMCWSRLVVGKTTSTIACIAALQMGLSKALSVSDCC